MRRLLLPVVLLGAFLVPALAPAPAHAAGTLTVTVVGKGTVTGSGMSCSESGGVCQISGSSATLSATPAEGYSGASWQGCQLPLFSTCTMLSINGDVTVTATFKDAQAPKINSVTPPNGSTVAGNVRFTADVTDNSGTVTRVRFFVKPSSSSQWTRLGNDDTQPPFVTDLWTVPFGDQPIDVAVEAQDGAENVSGRTTVTYTPDNTPPETEILEAPDKRVVVRKKRALVSFTFGSSEEGSTFECSVDNYAWETCARRQDWVLPVGKHVLRVAALDPAGSPDLSPAVYRWKIIRKARR